MSLISFAFYNVFYDRLLAIIRLFLLQMAKLRSNICTITMFLS